jgi:peptide deformylase
MHQAKGIGLAAPQVGLSWRLFVIDIPDDPEDDRDASASPPTATRGPLVFINPALSRPEGELEPCEEGCLSLPEVRGEVLRPSIITVRAIGLDGQPFELRAGGLLARCIQHEFDHLEGTLIIDRMTQVSRLKVRGKVKALERGE